jgi:hypothetical protein
LVNFGPEPEPDLLELELLETLGASYFTHFSLSWQPLPLPLPDDPLLLLWLETEGGGHTLQT